MALTGWDEKYLSIAKEVSTWSKDPSTKVGAVIADSDGRIVAVGFNGFPRKIDDNTRLFDRGVKYKMTVHAEANVALIAGPAAREGTLYVHGAPVCADCAGLVIQSGIKRVVATAPCLPGGPASACLPSPAEKIDWNEHGRLALEMFAEVGLEFQPVE